MNIFGGIMDCDVIATGIVAAVKETDLNFRSSFAWKATTSQLGKKTLQRIEAVLSSPAIPWPTPRRKSSGSRQLTSNPIFTTWPFSSPRNQSSCPRHYRQLRRPAHPT